MKRILYIACLSLLIGCNSNHQIIKVIDGDSYILQDGTKIRLKDCDAPELQQAYGKEAKAFVENLILRQDVKITKKGKDKYRRTLAQIEVGGTSLAYLIVSNGYGHIHPRYCKDEALIAAHKKARKKRIGLFKSDYITPSEFRRKN